MSVPLIRWDAGDAYEVAFSTRAGGVSEGPFATLNLARRVHDEPDRVEENRRRLCAALGARPNRLALNYQRHTTLVHRARAGTRGAVGDGLWTDEPDLPLLALGADCALVALARVNGDRPAVAVVHAGRIGVLSGVLGHCVEALGGSVKAMIGPAIGPCCYEVGDDVAAPFRARFGAQIVRDGKLDLVSAAAQTLHEAGVASVERLDLCTVCREDLFFSYRRDGKPFGAHGVVARVA